MGYGQTGLRNGVEVAKKASGRSGSGVVCSNSEVAKMVTHSDVFLA